MILMNRTCLYLLFSVLFLTLSCTRSESLESIQDRVGKTAEAYYNLLLHGKYSDFVCGMAGSDSLPAAYREQMIANAAMFVQQQKDEHEGIVSISYARCAADTAHHTAQAYLTIVFKDKTQEVFCVPMIQKGDVWYMK